MTLQKKTDNIEAYLRFVWIFIYKELKKHRINRNLAADCEVFS